MKQFEMKQLREAKAYSVQGGQALHLHSMNQGGHSLFRNYSVIAHLFDQNLERLTATAKQLGVNVIKVEREGTDSQHIDLCGRPLERAQGKCLADLDATTLKHPVLTCGYRGHTPAQLKLAAEKIGALVIDIRHKPVSRIPGWNLTELHQLFESESEAGRAHLMHLPDLGNVAISDGGSMRLANKTRGIHAVLRFLQERPVILFCGCAEFSECHRSLVSRLLAEKGIETQELEWPETDTDNLKAISLWQPWASLIAIGAKCIETRSWRTDYRGPLVIHAAQKTTEMFSSALPHFYDAFQRAQMWTIPEAAREYFDERALKMTYINDLNNRERLSWLPLPLGAVVAVADLVDCVPTSSLIGQISLEERTFGDYSAGRFGWVLENVRPLKEPIPYRGAQQLFNVDRAVLEGAFT